MCNYLPKALTLVGRYYGRYNLRSFLKFFFFIAVKGRRTNCALDVNVALKVAVSLCCGPADRTLTVGVAPKDYITTVSGGVTATSQSIYGTTSKVFVTIY